MTADTRAAIGQELAYVRQTAVVLARRVGLEHDADDVASAALLTALNGADRFTGGSLHAWLKTIIDYELRNRGRAARRRRTIPLETTSPDGKTHLVVEPAAEGAQEITLLIRELDAALPRLPVEQADVVRLVTIGGAPLDEAARLLGLPLGTVKSRLSRALTALREQLDHGPRREQLTSSAGHRRGGGRDAQRSRIGPDGSPTASSFQHLAA